MTISGAARVAGVCGWPVAHSRSPAIHGYWLEQHDIDGAYVPLAVAPDGLADALAALPKLGFAGVNLTVPHKEAALRVLDEVDGNARRIGAVNTVVVDEAGRLHGSNTDAFGFIEDLRAQAPGDIGGGAVVLGAGGAARAVCVGLLDAGIGALRVVNRTRTRAEVMLTELAPAVPSAVVDWADRAAELAGADIVVNSTVLGMTGQPPLDLDLAALPSEAVVYDIVYAPLVTPLLAAARARGNVAIDGLGMLLHQARPGFAAWFGVLPEVTPALRDAVLAA